MIGEMTKTVQNKHEGVTSNEVKSSIAKDSNLAKSSSMKNLLVSHDETIEDKIATVKTAQLLDSARFENAFKTLMKR